MVWWQKKLSDDEKNKLQTNKNIERLILFSVRNTSHFVLMHTNKYYLKYILILNIQITFLSFFSTLEKIQNAIKFQ